MSAHRPEGRGVAARQRFAELALEWRQATAPLSSTTARSTHPAYQQIIGMGPAAVPLILRELDREGGQWFWVLMAARGPAGGDA